MSLFSWAAALNPVALIGNALAGGEAYLNYKAQQDANKQNKKNVEATNAANVALWREQAAYNSPIEQMKRLEAAGLSPQLAYGQVADAKMASAPSMQAPEYKPPQLSGLSRLAESQQIMNLQALNTQTRMQTEKIKAETLKAMADASYALYENKTLQSSGSLKSDPSLIKNLGRGLDLLKDRARSWIEFMHNERSREIAEKSKMIQLRRK